jgi:hypothetical protein
MDSSRDDRPAPGPPAGPAVPPRLRPLLRGVLVLLALLFANSLYLGGVTLVEWLDGRPRQGYLYLWMFIAHLGLGLALVVPLASFLVRHVAAAYRRRNRRAVAAGFALLVASVATLASGVVLMRLGLVELRAPQGRALAYWTHVLAPLAALWLYLLHRLAGPPLRWRRGLAWTAAAASGLLALAVTGPAPDRGPEAPPVPSVAAVDAPGPFAPSLIRTADGRQIAPGLLMMDYYCRECHADVHDGWSRSVHRFSSFNNAPYAASVKETRRVVLARDGTLAASRWCAGCHDPVPLLAGIFDREDLDLESHPTGHAGITCTVCHAVTRVNSPRGNADMTIEAPRHYPFTFSGSGRLRALGRQLVKAKPSFHKQTFLKPVHRTAEFCSACHKVHLPGTVTQYKDFLRGQNHYDSHLLSGVSGHGARSFYYPDRAVPACAGCHMPLQPSDDFAARPDEDGRLSVRGHLFPAANTAIAHLRGDGATVAEHQAFLAGKLRVDIFGLRAGGGVDDPLLAPLRPDLPVLRAGGRYLVETVVRTLGVGHQFTQGTADSNQVWVDVRVTDGTRVVGRSGGIDAGGRVDPWAHFVNVYMLDREGRRIDRRNAQDIFVPLYDHQIPPGAAQVVHHALELPAGLRGAITIDVRLQYRKFDRAYMDFVFGPGRAVELPITTLAADTVTLPVGVSSAPAAASLTGVAPADGAGPAGATTIPEWQRWNDYGIGLLLEGAAAGERGELRQAAEAFRHVERLGRADGPLNLARVYLRDGQLDGAAAALARARALGASWWTLAWLSAGVAREQGDLETAIANYRTVLETRTGETVARGFDFSKDYEVINALGLALVEQAASRRGPAAEASRREALRAAAEVFTRTLALDPENLTAHYNLGQIHALLGDAERAASHRALHARYKPDDNARDRAVAIARRADPAADHAAQAVVVYPLHRPDAPGRGDTVPDRESPAGQPSTVR